MFVQQEMRMTCGSRSNQTKVQSVPKCSASSNKMCLKPKTKKVYLSRVIITLVSKPEYVIESKMSLAQAASENTLKIVNEQSKINAGQANNKGRLLTDDSANEKSVKFNAVIAPPMTSDILFEGTFKPNTHLGQYQSTPNVEDGGIPFGTFGGGPQIRLDDRKSYPDEYNVSGGANDIGNQMSFYTSSRAGDTQRDTHVTGQAG